MGKSGKTKASKNSKTELKAVKKAKLAQKAERKEAKAAVGVKGGSGVKKDKGQAKGKGKAKENQVEEEDLIQTLAEYRKRWEDGECNDSLGRSDAVRKRPDSFGHIEHRTSEEVADVPSRRANATLTACPVSTNTLWLYGGEYFDGTSCYFYPELYRYNTDKEEWRKLSSPTQPSPRSAHQIIASPVGGGKLWLFGGEYAALNQTSFHHYRDLWAFDISTRSWERFDTKVKPSARSGHRMTLWKNFIVLFGGFHDVGVRTTYLSDLWVWDTTTYHWHEIVIRDTDRRPTARSGFSLLSCPDGIILHGGYCKEYQGKQVKGVALDDTWFLRMDSDTTKLKWERRKKVGYAPTVRSGVQMTYWPAKAIGISFGGVLDSYDVEEDEIVSVFYNELYGYQTAGNGRWISLALKRPKKKASVKRGKKKQLPQEMPRPTAEESDDNENVESDEGSVTNEDKQQNQQSQSQVMRPSSERHCVVEERDEDDADDPVKTTPIARYNAMMAVQKNVLYIYGGIVESQNREYTLDDFYSLVSACLAFKARLFFI